ncbi:hypothetical protein [Nocardiopsis metallicus]|uniref:Uncharacterized protein n=1 Tax=Nocardiopsis metallicus TaxID=179819 RepID=A0A840WFL8_9ACTN|nr:hypothetical protein [Nocardiopsis metallicus]MBB5495770.1 hypothetical protein [Nocardiopsis metallicus]
MNPNRMGWPELVTRLRLVVDAMPTQTKLSRAWFPAFAVLVLVLMATTSANGFFLAALVLSLVGTVVSAAEIWALVSNDDNFVWVEETEAER